MKIKSVNKSGTTYSMILKKKRLDRELINFLFQNLKQISCMKASKQKSRVNKFKKSFSKSGKFRELELLIKL